MITRGLLRAVAASAVALCALALTPAPHASAADDEAVDAIGASVTAIGPAIATAATPVSVSATITNLALEDALGVTANLAITTAPLDDYAALDAWLAGSETETRRLTATAPASGRVGAHSEAGITLTVPAGRLRLPNDAWGVWGLETSVVIDGAVVRTFRSAMTWRGAGVTPATVPLTVIATVAGSPERSAALATAAGTDGVTVAADPTAVTINPDLPPAYVLPAGNLDIESVLRADRTSLLDEALGRSGLGNTSSVPWLAVLAEPDGPTLRLAARRGAAAALIEPAYGWQDYAELPALSRTGDGLAVVAPDYTLSDVLAHAAPSDPASRANVTAYGALAAKLGGPVVVSAGPRWMINGDQRSPVLAALIASPWLTPTSLETLLADELPTLEVSAISAGGSDVPVSSTIRVAQAVAAVTALEAAVADDEPIGATSVPALLRSLALEGRLDTERRTAAISSALEAAAAVRSAVGITEGSVLNLFTSEGNVPLSVYNDLSVPVTVRVVMESRSPNLVVKGSPEVTVEPGSVAQVQVPVEAVSSANVTVTLGLENLDGAPIAQRTNLAMRVRADWGQGFTVAVAVLAGALLAGGLYRTVRRGRGETRASGADPGKDRDD